MTFFIVYIKSAMKKFPDIFYFIHIGGVMVSVLASSVVDHGFESWFSQIKDNKLVFVASPLNTQHKGVKDFVGPESV